LDAFQIRPLVEPAEARPRSELQAFAEGMPSEVPESLSQALSAVQAQVPAPILLTQAVEPNAPLLLTDLVQHVNEGSLEEHFFAEAEATEADLEQANLERSSGRAIPLSRPAKITLGWLAIGLLSVAAGMVAWRLGFQEEPVPSTPVVPDVRAAAKPVAPVPAPTLVIIEPLEVISAAPAPAPAPEPLDAEIKRGMVLYDQGKPKEAADLLARYVQSHPKASVAWRFLGQARFDAGDWRSAEEAALRTLELDPKDGRAVLLLASVYILQVQPEKAQAQLRHYLEIEPKGPYAAEVRAVLASH
jgi:tetratricopeptide (TPR) repeat protein